MNVFGYEKGQVYPLRISKCEERTIIDLMLISNGKNQHYCWVKNMSRLLSSQFSKHDHGRYLCKTCRKSLERHSEYCSQHGFVRTVLSEEEIEQEDATKVGPRFLRFRNHNRSMRVPSVIYADFECFTGSLDSRFMPTRSKREVHEKVSKIYIFGLLLLYQVF